MERRELDLLALVVYFRGIWFMAIAVPPVGAPVVRRRVWVTLMLALLLGLLSLAAVREMKVECGPEYLTANDGATLLTADDGVPLLTTGRQRCQLELGNLRVPSPRWVHAILR
jgi:hypothetical protein